jgi:hypothetical protein
MSPGPFGVRHRNGAGERVEAVPVEAREDVCGGVWPYLSVRDLALVLAKPLKARMFPNRKEARRVRLIVERGTPLAELREEIEASEVPLERMVVRPSSVDQEDDAELVLGKGSREEELLSLMDGLRRVSGVRDVSSALSNGSAESKHKQ